MVEIHLINGDIVYSQDFYIEETTSLIIVETSTEATLIPLPQVAKIIKFVDTQQ